MAKKGAKAQGMPLNIIIIAVILLIVLVVILSIFSGNIGKFSKDLQSCGTRNGVCKESCGGEVQIEGVACPKKRDKEQVCCVKVGE